MPQLDIWPVSEACVTEKELISTHTGVPSRLPSCIILSAKTYCISILYSGPLCFMEPVSVNRPRCSRTDSLPLMGKKCRNHAAPISQPAAYLNQLDSEYLRYYFATKLNSRVEDIDLNLDDFAQRVNSDLVGKVVNIASRCAGFISRRFDGRLGSHLPDSNLFDDFIKGNETIIAAYEAREFSRAMREIMFFADRANQYLNAEQPWTIARESGKDQQLQAICTLGLNLFRFVDDLAKPSRPDVGCQN